MEEAIKLNQGSLLVGGFVAIGLSGTVAVQTLLYFEMYPMDPMFVKELVLLIRWLSCAAV